MYTYVHNVFLYMHVSLSVCVCIIHPPHPFSHTVSMAAMVGTGWGLCRGGATRLMAGSHVIMGDTSLTCALSLDVNMCDQCCPVDCVGCVGYGW